MTTYYVSAATGNDSDTGLTEALAWLTIDHAMNTIAEGDKVWVKADGNYAELVTIDTVGGSTTPIVFEGYSSTTGDNGQATITGSDSRANCVVDSKTAGTIVWYIFKNFRFTAATDVGFLTDCDKLTFKNCKFDNNGSHGLQCRLVGCEKCEFSDNTTDGCVVSALGGIFINCKFYSNGQNGLNTFANGVSCVAFGCICFDNAVNSIKTGGNLQISAIINCVCDGNTKNSNTGILMASTQQAVVNTVMYDCDTGFATESVGELLISRNNCVNANTTAYSNAATFTGEVTSAPQFTNEVGGADYTPAAGSPLIDAGFNG